MELLAKMENVGPFHLFWTLSCADQRFSENYSSVLQDQNISYVFENGREEIRINNQSVEEFLEKHTSKHQFIQSNLLTAARNYEYRVKAFIKMIVMNVCTSLKVKYYSYRIEFQMRGNIKCSKHKVHGIPNYSFL